MALKNTFKYSQKSEGNTCIPGGITLKTIQ